MALGAAGPMGLRDGGSQRQLVLLVAQGVQWFTGNIGFHHIHHLSPAIPSNGLNRQR
jgi:fatty acid desaturase